MKKLLALLTVLAIGTTLALNAGDKAKPAAAKANAKAACCETATAKKASAKTDGKCAEGACPMQAASKEKAGCCSADKQVAKKAPVTAKGATMLVTK